MAAQGLRVLMDAQLGDDPNAFYEMGTIYKSNGDIEGWFKNIKKAAELGVPDAQCALGIHMLADPLYSRVGFHWVMDAAEKMHPEALFTIGTCYDRGIGVSKNDKNALLFMKASAMEHYEMAYLELVKMFLKNSDWGRASMWLEKTKETGVKSLIERYPAILLHI
jgi:TPR repeat protein